MSMHATYSSEPHTEGESRRSLLTRLADNIRAWGGTALLALAHTDHPVLYVRHRGRTIPVVVVHGVTGGQWFIWGRSAFVDTSQIEIAATYLAEPPPPPYAPRPEPARGWSRTAVPQQPQQPRQANLVTARRAELAGVA